VSATDQEVAELKQEFSKRMAAQQKEISRLKAKLEEAKTKAGPGGAGGSTAQARLRDREGYITSLQACFKPSGVGGGVRSVAHCNLPAVSTKARLLGVGGWGGGGELIVPISFSTLFPL